MKELLLGVVIIITCGVTATVCMLYPHTVRSLCVPHPIETAEVKILELRRFQLRQRLVPTEVEAPKLPMDEVEAPISPAPISPVPAQHFFSKFKIIWEIELNASQDRDYVKRQAKELAKIACTDGDINNIKIVKIEGVNYFSAIQ
jgi:hypothetical protein